MAQYFNDEYLFEIDEFNQNKKYTDGVSFAKNFQNLCLTEKGTYPNCPDLGIGIHTFIYEFLDTDTILEIKRLCEYNIKTYLNSIIPFKLEVVPLTKQINNRRINTIAIYLTLNLYNAVKEIIISFSQEKKSTSIVSEIVVS